MLNYQRMSSAPQFLRLTRLVLWTSGIAAILWWTSLLSAQETPTDTPTTPASSPQSPPDTTTDTPPQTTPPNTEATPPAATSTVTLPLPATLETAQAELEQRGYKVVPVVTNPDLVTPTKRAPVSLRQLLATTSEEFDQQLQQTSFATIESAVYRATVVGEDLHEGEFVCEVTRRGQQMAPLDWTSINLAIQSLAIQSPAPAQLDPTGLPTITPDRTAAVWGTAPDGRILVMIDADRSQLVGRWSAHGKTLGGSVSPMATVPPVTEAAPPATTPVFPRIRQLDLSFPPALNTKFEVRVPHNEQLTASAGLVTGPQRIDAEWSLWTIELGRRRDVRLTIEALRGNPPPRVHGRLEIAYSARREGLQLQVDLGLKSFLTPLKTLVVAFPPTLELQAATINSVPVPIQLHPEQPGLATVIVGEIPPEQFSQLRITANQAVAWGPVVSLPQLTFPHVQITTGRTTLLVESPLAAHSLVTSQLLQTGFSSDTLGELWTFQHRGPNSELQIGIAQPAVDLKITTETVAVLRDDLTTAVVRAHIQCQSGTTYRTQFRIPLDWQVLNIQSSDASSSSLAWIETVHEKERELEIAHSRPLHAGQMETLLVTLHGPDFAISEPLTFPRFRPVLAGDTSGITYFVVPPDMIAESVSESSAEVDLRGTALPEELWQLLIDRRLANSLPAQRVTEYRWRSPNTPPQQIRLTRDHDTLLTPSEELAIPSRPDTEALAPALPNPTGSTTSTSWPGTVSLELSTALATHGAGQHLSRALFHFSRPVAAGDLQLTLPETCFVSAVALDGENVTVLRRGDRISFPEHVAAAHELELLYMTRTAPGLFFEDIDLPVPKWQRDLDRFEWRIETSAEHQVEPLKLNDAVKTKTTLAPFTIRLLGPLARRPSQTLFNPFDADNWRELGTIDASRVQPGGTVTEVVIIAVSPTSPLQVRCWHLVPLHTLSWVALLGCGWFGIAIRMWRWSPLRNLTIPWLVLLGVLTVMLPPGLAIVTGGGFMGTLLALLVPRRFAQRTDLLTWTDALHPVPEQHTRRAPPAVVTLLIVCTTWLALHTVQVLHTAQAQPAAPLVSEVQLEVRPDGNIQAYISGDQATRWEQRRADQPAYLLGGAEFEFLPTEQTTVRATFLVRVLDRETADVVQLPLSEIVLRNGATCQVDGTAVELIPTATGGGLLVALPAAATSKQHRITLEFGVRPDMVGNYSATIPRIPASLVRYPQLQGEVQFLRQGDLRPGAAGEQLVHLGPAGRLAWHSGLPPEPPRSSLTVRSNVVVDPLLTGVSTTLTFDATATSTEAEILLPFGADVRPITGQDLVEYQLVPTDPQGTWLKLKLAKPNATLQFEYEFPTQLTPAGAVRLPTPHFVSQNVMVHELTITTGPGKVISVLQDTQGRNVEPVIAPETSDQAAASRPNSQRIVSVQAGQELLITLADAPHTLAAKVAERCFISRTEARYAAQVQLSPGAIPWYVHRLRLGADWRVVEILVEQMGATRSVRWSQRGDEITVFLTEIAEGPRTLQVKASRPLLSEVWVDIPHLQVQGTTSLEQQLVVIDETDWTVEVETVGGTILATPATQPVRAEQDQAGSPSQLSFPLPGPIVPNRLRLIPDRNAARAESVTMIQKLPNGNWQATQQVHVQALEARLHRLVLQIPADRVEQLRLSPENLRRQVSNRDANWSEVTIHVPPRQRDAITVSLTWEVTEAALLTTGLRACRISSALEATQFLLLPMNSELQISPNSGRIVPGTALPGWVSGNWLGLLRRQQALCYQLTNPDAQLAAHPHELGQAHIRWAEHLVWLHPDGTSHGQLRFWGSSPRQLTLEILLDAGTVVDEVSAISDSQFTVRPSKPTAVELTINESEGVFDLLLQWHRPVPTTAVLRVPRVQPLEPEQALIVTVTGDNWHVQPSANMPVATPTQIGLARWNGYMDCLSSTPGAVAITSSILKQVRIVRTNLEAEMATLPVTEQATVDAEYKAALSRWEQLMEQLSLNASPDAAPVDAASIDRLNSLTQLHSPAIFMTVVTGQQHVLEAERLRPEPLHWPQTGLLLLVILMGLVVALLTWRLTLRDWFARHPAVALAVLGTIWWLWLAPSVLGWLLFVCGLVWWPFSQTTSTSPRPTTLQPQES